MRSVRRAAETDGEERIAAYSAAVAPFIALNRIENDHSLPMIYYYRSFAERGSRPPEQAVLGLKRAAELAPFDLGLRLMALKVPSEPDAGASAEVP